MRLVTYLWTADDFFMLVKALPEIAVMLAHRGVTMVNLRLLLNFKRMVKDDMMNIHHQ